MSSRPDELQARSPAKQKRGEPPPRRHLPRVPSPDPLALRAYQPPLLPLALEAGAVAPAVLVPAADDDAGLAVGSPDFSLPHARSERESAASTAITESFMKPPGCRVNPIRS